MKSNMEQPLFCALIKFYGQGNYSSFKKICDIVFPENHDKKYFINNILLASNIVGLIEIFHRDAIFKWSSNLYNNGKSIQIGTSPLKNIGITSDWFESYKQNVVPLIYDQFHDGLIIGTVEKKEHPLQHQCIFDDKYFEYMPRISLVEKRVCEKENYSICNSGRVQQFDIDNLQWTLHSIDEIANPALIRVERKFSGIQYYIIYPSLQLCYRIRYPEWTFIFASMFLGWKNEKFMNYSSGILSINIQYRLPTLLLRYLFSFREYVKIEFKIGIF